jgi:ABC-type sugar transport system permease subunit
MKTYNKWVYKILVEREVEMDFKDYDTTKNNKFQDNPSAYSSFRDTEDVMTVMEWVGVITILFIPLINIIMFSIWAFGKKSNMNLKNFCRAILVVIVIGFCLKALREIFCF